MFFGEKFRRRYALTSQGIVNVKKAPFWTVVVNLVVMCGDAAVSAGAAELSLTVLLPPNAENAMTPMIAAISTPTAAKAIAFLFLLLFMMQDHLPDFCFCF